MLCFHSNASVCIMFKMYVGTNHENKSCLYHFFSLPDCTQAIFVTDVNAEINVTVIIFIKLFYLRGCVRNNRDKITRTTIAHLIQKTKKKMSYIPYPVECSVLQEWTCPV